MLQVTLFQLGSLIDFLIMWKLLEIGEAIFMKFVYVVFRVTFVAIQLCSLSYFFLIKVYDYLFTDYLGLLNVLNFIVLIVELIYEEMCSIFVY